VYTREEEFVACYPRQPAQITVQTGVGRDGRLLTRDVFVLLDCGAYSSHGATTLQAMLLTATSLYQPRAVRFRGRCVYTNNPSSGSMRGFGNPQITFALESQMDIVAERLQLDPLALRLLNANEPGAETLQGARITSCQLRSCLSRAAQAIDWHALRRQRKPG